MSQPNGMRLHCNTVFSGHLMDMEERNKNYLFTRSPTKSSMDGFHIAKKRSISPLIQCTKFKFANRQPGYRQQQKQQQQQNNQNNPQNLFTKNAKAID